MIGFGCMPFIGFLVEPLAARHDTVQQKTDGLLIRADASLRVFRSKFLHEASHHTNKLSSKRLSEELFGRFPIPSLLGKRFGVR